MSFMSGIMMGAAIGRNIHEIIGGKKKWKSNQLKQGSGPKDCRYITPVQDFSLVSNLPGRCRYRIGSLVNNGKMAALLEKELAQEKSISQVEINTLTGSLLIIHTLESAEIAKLTTKLCTLTKPFMDKPGYGGKANGNNAPVLYAKNWHNTALAINNQVRYLTRGWFDLSTLLSVFFLLRGIRKMLIYGQRPSGPTMVWWALHMMKGWKY